MSIFPVAPKIQEIIDWIIPGNDFYYYDCGKGGNPEIIKQYKPGMLVGDDNFLSVTRERMKPILNLRYLIASSKVADVTVFNSELEKYHMRIINKNALFLVLDVQQIEETIQVVLLHIPVRAMGNFAKRQSFKYAENGKDFYTQVKIRAWKDFEECMQMGPQPKQFLDEEWIYGHVVPIGYNHKTKTIGNNSESKHKFPLEEVHLYNGIRKLSQDLSDINQIYGSFPIETDLP